MTENNPPPLPTWEQRRDTAREAVANWMRELELAQFQIGYRGGYQEGFTAGWQAHVEHINTVFANYTVAPEPTQPQVESSPTPINTAPPTNNDMVLSAIIARPGLRGVELVKQLEASAFPVPERSVRTSLHRLKKAEKIKIVDGRWYAAEAVPANPQLALTEKDMDPS